MKRFSFKLDTKSDMNICLNHFPKNLMDADDDEQVVTILLLFL